MTEDEIHDRFADLIVRPLLNAGFSEAKVVLLAEIMISTVITFSVPEQGYETMIEMITQGVRERLANFQRKKNETFN